MKIQLLQDIEDSGAAPLQRRPQAAVWQRAGAAPGDGQVPPGEERPPERAPPRTHHPIQTEAQTWSQGQAQTQNRPEREADAPPFSTLTSDASPAESSAPSASEPEWLAELMRQDAERADAQQNAGQWKRRLFTWAIAGSVLAALVGGGLWLYEERRVDGALVVVAETTPPAATALAPVAPPAPPPAAAAHAVAPAPAVAPADKRESTLPGIIRALPEVAFPAAPAQTAGGDGLASAASGAGREHRVSTVRTDAKQAAERERTTRHRREETLLQCRALGYDEAQCVRRGCEMTRFGLACRG